MEIPFSEEHKYAQKFADHQLELPPVAYSKPRSNRNARVMAGLRRVLLAASLLALLTYLPGVRTLCLGDHGDTSQVVLNSGYARLGAVASESNLCSRYGGDMLKNGGNAADAVSPSTRL